MRAGFRFVAPVIAAAVIGGAAPAAAGSPNDHGQQQQVMVNSRQFMAVQFFSARDGSGGVALIYAGDGRSFNHVAGNGPVGDGARGAGVNWSYQDPGATDTEIGASEISCRVENGYEFHVAPDLSNASASFSCEAQVQEWYGPVGDGGPDVVRTEVLTVSADVIGTSALSRWTPDVSPPGRASEWSLFVSHGATRTGTATGTIAGEEGSYFDGPLDYAEIVHNAFTDLQR